MAFIIHARYHNVAPVLTHLRHIGAKCGLVVVVAASLPIALLALPIVLLTKHSLKDGEYWD